MNMRDILADFTSKSLFEASCQLLDELGVKTSTQTMGSIPLYGLYEKAAQKAGSKVPKPIEELFKRIKSSYFVGEVTDDTLNNDVH